jgi:hypothetical protein
VHFIFVLCICFYHWAYIQSNGAFSIVMGNCFYHWACIQGNGAFSMVMGICFYRLGVYIYRVLGIFYTYCAILFITGRLHRALGILHSYWALFLLLGVTYSVGFRFGGFRFSFYILGDFRRQWAFVLLVPVPVVYALAVVLSGLLVVNLSIACEVARSINGKMKKVIAFIPDFIML